MSELSPLAWRLRRCLLTMERRHVLLAEAWTCLIAAEPELARRSDRRARIRDAFDELAASGWIALPTSPRAYARGDPPLPRSVRLLGSTDRPRRLGAARAVAWQPALAWATELDLSPDDADDLARIDEWIATRTDEPVLVPPRERSLQLFGAGREDRLHELASSELFGQDRLSWELLACVPVPPPFVWSPVGPGGLLLVVSGHETFASLRRALVEAPGSAVGIVAHGAGDYFRSSVTFADMLDRTIDRILYYGDLDADDLRVPPAASGRAERAGLPRVEPAEALYDLLLRDGQPAFARPVHVDEAGRLAAWLPTRHRDEVVQLLVGGGRIVQEWVGYELLLAEEIWSRLP